MNILNRVCGWAWESSRHGFPKEPVPVLQLRKMLKGGSLFLWRGFLILGNGKWSWWLAACCCCVACHLVMLRFEGKIWEVVLVTGCLLLLCGLSPGDVAV